MIKILHFPFSSALESTAEKYLQYHANGKSSYFKRKVQLQLAAIT